MGRMYIKMVRIKRTFIVAEAGVNHNGKLSNALKLVRIAKRCGADAVKFQTWITDEIILPNTKRPKYQIVNDKNADQYSFAKQLELKFDDFLKIKKYCDKLKINFLSTADDIKSIKFLKKLQNFYKIGSADLNNHQMINEICKQKKKIFISTGLSEISDINNLIKFLKKINFDYKNKLILMQCNTAYPTPYKDVHLNVIPYLKKKFDIKIGYSDHTLSDECSIAAVALGAQFIEKHLTINKRMKGPDHLTSLDENEFSKMVIKIRNIEKSLGSNKKKITKSAMQNKKLMGRSIVAKKIILKGEKFLETNITSKRPAGGLDPNLFFYLINKKSKKTYKINDRISKLELKKYDK